MGEKRMLILPAELVQKIDENRGDMTQAEFINFLIDEQLKKDPTSDGFVTKDALLEFEHGIKDLLRTFLEFVVSYGLELGKVPGKGDLEELNQRLGGLHKSFGASEKGGSAKDH
ncbi:MAG: hypothetical protein DRI39_08325 [Chloroflexi bacterium]|nr:MAG: hypothetical protein DRI39_08325 [Chloroflexota bacterium]RLC97137.1 MAG: hypothetical protein DRI40_01085 [Chloroflexota bacterium]